MQRKKFVWAGCARGLLSTIPGSIIFAFISSGHYAISNHQEIVLFDTFFYLTILLGLFLSFIPSLVGGRALAIWIYTNPREISAAGGAGKGAMAGFVSMIIFDLFIGLLSFAIGHGPSLRMFVFYASSSTLIATLASMWVGLQLTHRLAVNAHL